MFDFRNLTGSVGKLYHRITEFSYQLQQWIFQGRRRLKLILITSFCWSGRTITYQNFLIIIPFRTFRVRFCWKLVEVVKASREICWMKPKAWLFLCLYSFYWTWSSPQFELTLSDFPDRISLTISRLRNPYTIQNNHDGSLMGIHNSTANFWWCLHVIHKT